MIEHIQNYGGVLSALRRVVSAGGQLVISTPNQPEDWIEPANPHHVKEFSADESEQLLQDVFPAVQKFGQ